MRRPTNALHQDRRAIVRNHRSSTNGCRQSYVCRLICDHGEHTFWSRRGSEGKTHRFLPRRIVHIAPTRNELRKASSPTSACIGGGAVLRVDDVTRHRSKVAQSRCNTHGLRIGIANPIPARIQINDNYLCLDTQAHCRHGEQAQNLSNSFHSSK